MKKQILMTLITLTGFGVYAQDDNKAHNNGLTTQQVKINPSFKDKTVGLAYSQYITLKNALVVANSVETKNAARELQKSLSLISNGKQAAIEAGKIAATDDIKAQRNSFIHLSNEFIEVVKVNKPLSGEVFLAYCPMANNNNGAYWLSNEKEIKNPYFGDMMLRCGMVKEIL